MDRTQKVEFLNDVGAQTKDAKIAILADFTGVTVAEVNAFRKKLRSRAGVTFRVGKNTLYKRVFNDMGWTALEPHLKGPTGVLLGLEDAVEAAKAALEFSKENDKFKVKVGFFEGALADKKMLETLASLPGKDQLRAQFLGVLQAVPQKFVGLLQVPARDLVSLLENYRKKQAGEE